MAVDGMAPGVTARNTCTQPGARPARPPLAPAHSLARNYNMIIHFPQRWLARRDNSGKCLARVGVVTATDATKLSSPQLGSTLYEELSIMMEIQGYYAVARWAGQVGISPGARGLFADRAISAAVLAPDRHSRPFIYRPLPLTSTITAVEPLEDYRDLTTPLCTSRIKWTG
ncbi:hypothetical protein J6590_037759 [Homalodisca vitripennis]|nr:hypothetical protein J6590_037759 [Homalodisca vitripennis]